MMPSLHRLCRELWSRIPISRLRLFSVDPTDLKTFLTVFALLAIVAAAYGYRIA
jgi:hypothetical protein